MGKRIISQARGKGSLSYRVRAKAYIYRIKYPKDLKGEGVVVELLNSVAHSAPLAKIRYSKGEFYVPACKGMIEGQKIEFDSGNIKEGNIERVSNIPIRTKIFCIESRPGDGGAFVKTSGNSAEISKIIGEKIFILFPSGKEKELNPACRAIIGVIAGAGRKDKPIVKAGKNHYIKKTRNKLWPRTSAVKMNAVDHPFGSGRGKRIKSKIAKRNAPPGARVGLLSPARTGRKKR